MQVNKSKNLILKLTVIYFFSLFLIISCKQDIKENFNLFNTEFQLSYDDNKVGYLVKKTETLKNSYYPYPDLLSSEYELEIIDLEKYNTKNLGNAKSFVWLDNDNLIILKGKTRNLKSGIIDGNNEIVKLNYKTKESSIIKSFFDEDFDIKNLRISPNRKKISFLQKKKLNIINLENKKTKSISLSEELINYYFINDNEVIFILNSNGNNLKKININNEKIDSIALINGSIISPDNNLIAILSSKDGEKSISTLNLINSKITNFYSDKNIHRSFISISHNKKNIAFIKTIEKSGYYSDIFLLDLEKRDVKNITLTGDQKFLEDKKSYSISNSLLYQTPKFYSNHNNIIYTKYFQNEKTEVKIHNLDNYEKIKVKTYE